MDLAAVLLLINQFIIANGNNEITADVLRPILEAMVQQPNDLVGALADLNTDDQTSIVNAINSILSQNAPNKTILFPIDTTGVDFDQDELLWVRDAINNTALANGAFTCNLGEQMVFYCDVILDTTGTDVNLQRQYYRLTTGAVLVSSLGTGDNPPLMPDGTESKTLDTTGDLVIDLGDIGASSVEDAFNSDPNQPFTINGDKFVQAVQSGDNKLWQWIGGDGTFGNSATLALASYFVDLTDSNVPVSGYVPYNELEVDLVTDSVISAVEDGISLHYNVSNFIDYVVFDATFTKLALDFFNKHDEYSLVLELVNKTVGENRIVNITDMSLINANQFLKVDVVDTVIDQSTGFFAVGQKILVKMYPNVSNGAETDTISIFGSDLETDLETGQRALMFAPYDFTLDTYWLGALIEPPTGASLGVDIEKNHVSVTSTPASIDDGEATSLTGVQPVITTSSFSKGDEIGINILGVGSTNPGKGLQINFEITKT